MTASYTGGNTRRPRRNFILQGCAVAVSGAFIWITQFTVWNGWDAILFGAYAVLIASWFVIPIGLLLGYLLPSFVAGASTFRAMLTGVAFGVGSAVLAWLFTGISGFGERHMLLSMMAVCSGLVALWSVRVARTAPIAERNKLSKGFREWLAIGKTKE
jgi:hypothetical protein